MTQSNIKPFAIFPDLPRQVPFLADDKMMHPLWLLYFDQLTAALQFNFKPEGMVIPQQTAADIALLTGQVSNANIVYDSTNDLFKGNVAGTWKTFTLT